MEDPLHRRATADLSRRSRPSNRSPALGPEMTHGFQEGFVRVFGHRLFWKSLGDGDRGTILCLHGGPGGNHWFTMPMADMASLGYKVVMYDQYGCGRSDRPRSYARCTIEAAAREVDGVRQALHLGRCHLWGSSYGGALALQAVLDAPRSFRKLLLSSAFASVAQVEGECARLVRELPPRDRAAIEDVEVRGHATTAAYRRAVATFYRLHGNGLPVRPYEVTLGFEGMNRALQAAMVTPEQGLLARSTGTMAGWDVRERLPRIRLPTLVMVGRADFVTPARARTIHRGIAGSELVVFEDAGHEPSFKQRGRYMERVRAFLAAA